MSVRSRNFARGWMLATALAVLMLPTASRAYSPEQQQACSGDAFRLCGTEIPDVDRVTACMVRNKSELSPGCRLYFRADPDPAATSGVPERRHGFRPAHARRHAGTRPRKVKRSGEPEAN